MQLHRRHQPRDPNDSVAGLPAWAPPSGPAVLAVASRRIWLPSVALTIAERLAAGSPVHVLTNRRFVRGDPAFDALHDRVVSGAVVVHTVESTFVAAATALTSGAALVLSPLQHVDLPVRLRVPLLLCLAEGVPVPTWTQPDALLVEPGWTAGIPAVQALLPVGARPVLRRLHSPSRRPADAPLVCISLVAGATPLSNASLPLNVRRLRLEQERFWDVYAVERRFRRGLAAGLPAAVAALRPVPVAVNNRT